LKNLHPLYEPNQEILRSNQEQAQFIVGTMEIYDFCLAWNWEYDQAFVHSLRTACQAYQLSFLEITPDNLSSTLQALVDQQISFYALFDRASDVDENFKLLDLWARQQDILRINRFRKARRAWNKATMHTQFLEAGLDAPHTIVLPSCDEQPVLEPIDLTCLGECFAIKPVHGGGGLGVCTGATTWEQVLASRQQYPTDQYLLQSQVFPATLEDHPAWFRVIYCAGQVFTCWWDPATHVYTPLQEGEADRLNLHPLLEIPLTIADICQLELFSTEIALTTAGHFLVVDYVNDPIDLRLQSQAAEGVPDQIVTTIASRLALYVAAFCHVPLMYAEQA
jgi:hypothetical protein